MGQPEVSRNLKGNSRVYEWLKKNKRFVLISRAILAVIHPEQYETGLKILNCIEEEPMCLREPEYVQTMLDAWCSLFSGCAIIANCETPCHRDVGSRHEWYDVICTMGSYGTTMAWIPGLTAGFNYHAGMAIALCGQILAHKVDMHEDRHQVCFAWFMRDNIQEYIGISPGKGSQGEVLLMG